MHIFYRVTTLTFNPTKYYILNIKLSVTNNQQFKINNVELKADLASYCLSTN